MTFEVTVLGSSGAVPAYGRHTSAHFLSTETEDFLIDCGEATQHQLQRAGLSMGRVEYVLITHLHGDHYFGLPGLITSLALSGRTKPLRVVSPEPLRPRLNPLLEFDRFQLPFELEFIVHRATDLGPLLTTKKTEILAFPLRHRIPTNGYLLREKQRPANILAEKIEEYAIPYPAIPTIKNGGDFSLADGTVVPHAELTVPAPRPRSYAYCSDTIYFPELVEWVRGVDILYHEATFLDDMREDAHKKMHSTAREAAQVGADAGAGQLILGHFSARYADVMPLREEARAVFRRSYLGVELGRFVVPFRDRREI